MLYSPVMMLLFLPAGYVKAIYQVHANQLLLKKAEDAYQMSRKPVTELMKKVLVVMVIFAPIIPLNAIVLLLQQIAKL